VNEYDGETKDTGTDAGTYDDYDDERGSEEYGGNDIRYRNLNNEDDLLAQNLESEPELFNDPAKDGQ